MFPVPEIPPPSGPLQVGTAIISFRLKEKLKSWDFATEIEDKERDLILKVQSIELLLLMEGMVSSFVFFVQKIDQFSFSLLDQCPTRYVCSFYSPIAYSYSILSVQDPWNKILSIFATHLALATCEVSNKNADIYAEQEFPVVLFTHGQNTWDISTTYLTS